MQQRGKLGAGSLIFQHEGHLQIKHYFTYSKPEGNTIALSYRPAQHFPKYTIQITSRRHDLLCPTSRTSLFAEQNEPTGVPSAHTT